MLTEPSPDDCTNIIRELEIPTYRGVVGNSVSAATMSSQVAKKHEQTMDRHTGQSQRMTRTDERETEAKASANVSLILLFDLKLDEESSTIWVEHMSKAEHR